MKILLMTYLAGSYVSSYEAPHSIFLIPDEVGNLKEFVDKMQAEYQRYWEHFFDKIPDRDRDYDKRLMFYEWLEKEKHLQRVPFYSVHTNARSSD